MRARCVSHSRSRQRSSAQRGFGNGAAQGDTEVGALIQPHNFEAT